MLDTWAFYQRHLCRIGGHRRWEADKQLFVRTAGLKFGKQ